MSTVFNFVVWTILHFIIKQIYYLHLQCRLPHMWQSNFRCLRNRCNIFRHGVPGMFGANVPGHDKSNVSAPTSMWRHHDKHSDILLFGRPKLSTKICPRKYATSSDNKIIEYLYILILKNIENNGSMRGSSRVVVGGERLNSHGKVAEYRPPSPSLLQPPANFLDSFMDLWFGDSRIPSKAC